MRKLEFVEEPARPNSITLQIADYLDRSVPSSIPQDFGHKALTQTNAAVEFTDRSALSTLAAYLAITLDPVELATAAYMFGAVKVRLRMPDFATQQFAVGQAWSTREQHGQPTINGTRVVTVLGRTDGMFDLLTSGQHHRMDETFYRRFCDEAVVCLSLEFLQAGQFPTGFNLTQLHLDLMRHRAGSDIDNRPTRCHNASIARAERGQKHRRHNGRPHPARTHRNRPHLTLLPPITSEIDQAEFRPSRIR